MRESIRLITLDTPKTTCKGCGVCCERGIGGRVPFARGEAVPEWFRQQHESTEPCDGRPCPWWRPGAGRDDDTSGECAHYEDRPDACRNFVRGGSECLDLIREHLEDR